MVFLNSHTSLAEVFEGLVNSSKNEKDGVFFRDTLESLKETYLTTSTDPVVREILQVTRYAGRLLIWEYESIPSEDEIAAFGTSTDQCPCQHSWSHELPCRYVLQCRQKAGAPVFEADDIGDMWKKSGLGRCTAPPPEETHTDAVFKPPAVKLDLPREQYNCFHAIVQRNK